MASGGNNSNGKSTKDRTFTRYSGRAIEPTMKDDIYPPAHEQSRRTETVHTNSDDTAEDIDIKLEDSVPFACPTTTNILNLLDHVDGVFSARNDQEPATGNLMNEERPVISLTESTLLTRDASAPLVEHEGGSCNASVVALPGSPPARILGTASEVPRFTLGELTTQYMADMLQIIEGNGEQEE